MGYDGLSAADCDVRCRNIGCHHEVIHIDQQFRGLRRRCLLDVTLQGNITAVYLDRLVVGQWAKCGVGRDIDGEVLR
jgi:hypothetical protein